MKERFTLRFVRQPENTFQLVGTVFEEVDANGVVIRRKELKPAARAVPGQSWPLPDSPSVLLVALIFARVAQRRFERLADFPEVELPILREVNGAKVVSQFKNLRGDATKKTGDSHANRWLQEMFHLPGEEGETEFGGRLMNWFSVSLKPVGVVSYRPERLSPAAVSVVIDDAPATEAALDEVEFYLALKVGAGVPCQWEAEGVRLAGRPPSILPGWAGQEDEALELERLYLAREIPIVCVTGAAATGKTVFATYWLRRMLGTRKHRHKLVFAWTFPRQGAADFVRVLLTEFFRQLAEFFGVKLPPKAAPVETADLLLAALMHQPVLLFLDGIEATYSVAGPSRAELDTGLVRLLRGLARQSESFVIATSRADFAGHFGLPQTQVRLIQLQDKPRPDVAAFVAEYHDPSAAADRSTRNTAVADLLRVLKNTTGNQTDKQLAAWIKQAAGDTPAPPSPPAAALEGPTPLEKSLLNAYLKLFREAPERVILFILSACHDVVTETDLLTVAMKLPLRELLGREARLTREDWEAALNSLLRHQILEQASRYGHYSLHPHKRSYIAASLKNSAPSIWVVINKALAQVMMNQVPDLPDRREQLPPLMDAVIYLCNAGERRYAYEEVCIRRMSRGLKGYAIFHLGEYEAGKGANDALRADAGLAAVAALPAEAEAMCIHGAALCSRYLDELESALQQEREAWERAQASGGSLAMLPIAFNLLRLDHIFGLLAEAKTIEGKLIGLLLKDKIFGVGQSLPPADRVDGASALSAVLALTSALRGSLGLKINWILDSGIKECRNHGGEFRHLMPTFGRPWHALTLLETGRWEICEAAFELGEWGSDMVRFQQTGTYEFLAAKMFLAKARAKSGAARNAALASASGWADKARQKAETGNYRWWKTVSTLVQGEIFALDGQLLRASELMESALAWSKEFSFQLLTVDGLLAQASLALAHNRKAECQHSANAGLALAESIGYGLRKTPLQKLGKASR